MTTFLQIHDLDHKHVTPQIWPPDSRPCSGISMKHDGFVAISWAEEASPLWQLGTTVSDYEEVQQSMDLTKGGHLAGKGVAMDGEIILKQKDIKAPRVVYKSQIHSGYLANP